jgi:uncharacterized membrane-anchored protein YitT (DUF2179 family)
LKKILLLLLGAIIAGISFNLILIPGDIAPGGVSGIAVIINMLTKGLIPVGTLTAILNIPLFIAGYKVLGKSFIFRSFVGTILFSIMIDVLSVINWIGISDKIGLTTDGVVNDFILSSIWGGVLYGMGLGLIFRAGFTTGGTDIAARLLQRKFSWLSLGQLLLAMDILILTLVAITYEKPVFALYAGITIFLTSKLIDVVEAGLHYAKEVYVMTNKAEDIAKDVMTELDRGTTKMAGTGMYTGAHIDILICVIYNRQLTALRRIIDRHDPDAFIIIKDVREVEGLYSDL